MQITVHNDDDDDDDDDYTYRAKDDLIYSWDHCQGFCQFAYGLHLILWMIHLYTNIEMLHAWANGNLFLLMGTMWFILMAMWDMGLIMKYPEFLGMPTLNRTIPFGFALIFLAYYYIGVFSLIFKLKAGHRSLNESTVEVIFAYLLYLNTPTAIISTIYAILLPKYTRDIEADTNSSIDI